jgi:hypothetical protein
MTDHYRSEEDPDSTATPPRSGPAGAEPAVRQLDSIIENLASYATPVLREIAARAADLAAKAGEAAGPMAHKAADKTEEVAGRLATRGREVASDLRRDPANPGATTGTTVDPSGSEPTDGVPPAL